MISRTRQAFVGIAIPLSLAAGGCRPKPGVGTGASDEPARRVVAGGVCDSSTAARIALDSLARFYPFRSVVLRFERGTAGARIVTSPAPGARVLDGMAIVELGPDCRIRSLVQTDSA